MTAPATPPPNAPVSSIRPTANSIVDVIQHHASVVGRVAIAQNRGERGRESAEGIVRVSRPCESVTQRFAASVESSESFR